MRRKFILFTTLLVVALVSGVVVAEAQQRTKLPRIGVLLPTPTGVKTYLVSFRQGLEELGYIEGRNIVIEYRIADGKPDQYPGLAAELVNLKVDLIVTGSTPATQAVKNATKTVPIIMAAADPLGAGLVTSLAQPGGNITGLSMRSSEFIGKRLELLKEVVPRVHRVGILWNPLNASNAVSLKESQVVAQAMGLKLQSIEVQDPSDFNNGFGALTKGRTDAFTVLRDPFIMVHYKRIVELVAKSRLPAVYEGKEFVLAGGLMSYGASLENLFRRAATYVDKILKGANPGELPVEQPMQAEFIINLKAAKEIGLTIPPEKLILADKVFN